MKSPTSVALLFNDKMKNLDLVVSDYYNAVAFYAPKEKPETEMVSGGVRMKTYELPSDEMMRNNYVTGIAYTVKNNKTGRENTVLKTLADPDTPVIAIPDYQAGEEADISTYCRWYYQPYPNESTIYYSPKSNQETASVSEGDVLVDENFRMYIFLDLNMWDENSEEMRNSGYALEQMRQMSTTAHLVIKPDGVFSLSIKPVQYTLSKSTGEGYSESHTMNVSGVEISGRGTISQNDNKIILTTTSMTCNTITQKASSLDKGPNDSQESSDDFKFDLHNQQAVLTYTKNVYNKNWFEIELELHQTGVYCWRYHDGDPTKTDQADEIVTRAFRGTNP